MAVFLPTLKKRGDLDRIHITVCNIGSRKLSQQDDYSTKGWQVFAPHLSIYGFDADADACDAANADLEQRQITWTEKHIPLAISNVEGETTLYVTCHPMCSSLYPPNEALLSRFKGLPELVNLDFTVEIETTTLDAFCQAEGIQGIDFLQIDVQGAELKVLQGATQLLKTVLAVQLEVEFSPIYINQPLFADLDAYLRTTEFTLFHLVSAHRVRARSPLASRIHPGQLLWGEAYYFRDLLQETELHYPAPEQIFKLACIADVMDFPDYALELLEYLTLTNDQESDYNFADVIVESLAQIPEVVTQGLTTLEVVQNIRPYLTNPDLLLLSPETKPPAVIIHHPLESFHSAHYERHNQRRLEHLASLGLDLRNKTVLEIGAGIGDHTHFFLDRDCQVVTTEGRLANLELLISRYPALQVRHLDMDNPDPTFSGTFDLVYCYGLLYHLSKPAEAIAYMAERCQSMLLLETCVSYGEAEAINLCNELAESPSQSITGIGCRPTRRWVYSQLKQFFEFVYMPTTQPNHKEFPLDWVSPPPENHLSRSVFIASRNPLNNPLLIDSIPMVQQRH